MTKRAFLSSISRRSHTSRAVARTVLVGALVTAAGCAAVLGFEDPTLEPFAISDIVSDASVKDADATVHDATPDAPLAAAGTLSAAPSSLVLRRGRTADITLQFTRAATFVGSLPLHAVGLPTGIAATSVTLNAGGTSAKMTLSASKDAALGPLHVTIEAIGQTVAPASVAVVVADDAGAFDKTFDSDGWVVDTSGGLLGTFFALGVQPDASIVAGGAGAGGWLLKRFRATGEADVLFNAEVSGMPATGELRALALDAAGRIVAAGYSTVDGGAPMLTLVRRLPTGAKDPTFGTDGVVRADGPEGPLGWSGLGLVLQADGAVVVVGTLRSVAIDNDAGVTESGFLARFASNGVRDATFNGGSPVVVPSTRLVGVSLDAPGAMIAAGNTTGDAGTTSFVTKRTSTGAVDGTFGDAGALTFGAARKAFGMAVLPADHSIVVVGAQDPASYAVAAVSPKGALTFDRVENAASPSAFFGVAVDAQSRIVLAGHATVGQAEARVERVVADGGLDTSFGDAGVAFVAGPDAGASDGVSLYAAAMQADGRILVAGHRTDSGAVLFRLWQ